MMPHGASLLCRLAEVRSPTPEAGLASQFRKSGRRFLSANSETLARRAPWEPRGKHGTGSATYYSFGDTSDHEMPQPRAAVRAHDDQVTALFLGHGNYLFHRVAFRDKILDLNSLRCRYRAPKIFGDTAAVTLGFQFSGHLTVADSRRAQAGDDMQHQHGCPMLACQIACDVQGVAGMIRIIGWMEDAPGLEHENRHQKGGTWQVSTYPAGDVITSPGVPMPAAPLGRRAPGHGSGRWPCMRKLPQWPQEGRDLCGR